MAPIISFTAEEIWQSMRQKSQSMEDSVFLALFPGFDEEFYDSALEGKWAHLFILRNEVNKAIEIKRADKVIGNSLEAKIVLRAPDSLKTLLTEYLDFLPAFFIVSAVEIAVRDAAASYKSTEVEGLGITIEHAPGTKCQRCWNWSERVGTFEEDPAICERCFKVLFPRT
jgi:isoleucyl-tRNA synthetase